MGGAPLGAYGPVTSNVSAQSQMNAAAQSVANQMQRPVPGFTNSGVRKADWEVEEDRKDRELDEWLEASRQAVERAGAE